MKPNLVHPQIIRCSSIPKKGIHSNDDVIARDCQELPDNQRFGTRHEWVGKLQAIIESHPYPALILLHLVSITKVEIGTNAPARQTDP